MTHGTQDIFLNAYFRNFKKLESFTREGDSPLKVTKEATRKDILSTMRRYSRGNMGGMNIQP